MVECASASKTPKRSVSISSSRMGEAGTPAWLVSIMRDPPSSRGGWERSLRMCGVRAWRSPILLTFGSTGAALARASAVGRDHAHHRASSGARSHSRFIVLLRVVYGCGICEYEVAGRAIETIQLWC
jgi:hypothetical protein